MVNRVSVVKAGGAIFPAGAGQSIWGVTSGSVGLDLASWAMRETQGAGSIAWEGP